MRPSLLRLNYDPKPDERPFVGRVQVQSDEHAEVSVAVLTPGECKILFGVPLANRGVQAVWIRVVNRSPQGTRLLMTRVASDYYTAREAAAVCHFSMVKRLFAFGFMIWFVLPIVWLALPFKLIAIRRANRRMDGCFQKLGFPPKNIAPGAVSEGLVFTPLDFGTKAIEVALVLNNEVRDYLFSIEVPVPTLDYQISAARQTEKVEPVECDLTTLLQKISEVPPTTSNASGRRQGDPVNLVVIGNFPTVISVFASRWDQTEVITVASCWRTVKSFLFGTEYRYSPVSALYLFQRHQDFALQRVRDSIDARLHLRLWSTAWRFEGRTVWVGQVSRDIGVRFTLRTWNLTTHLIDPDVDESRDYVMEDLFGTSRIAGGGYVPGTGACSREQPRYNLTGDSYFTDGNRAVIMVSDEKTVPKILHWD